MFTMIKMCLATLLLQAVITSTVAVDICELVKDDLPTGCTCSDKKLGADLKCSVTILQETVAAEIDIEPCAAQPFVSVSITPPGGVPPITHKIVAGASGAGETGFPIPGLSFDFSPLAEAGAVLDYDLEVKTAGDTVLTVTLGIDACGSVFSVKKCISAIPDSGLPYYFLQNKQIDLGNFCGGGPTPPSPPGPTPPSPSPGPTPPSPPGPAPPSPSPSPGPGPTCTCKAGHGCVADGCVYGDITTRDAKNHCCSGHGQRTWTMDCKETNWRCTPPTSALRGRTFEPTEV